MIEPVAKAIDAALTALDEARTHLEHALRVADYDPAELERIEERLFALRAAARKYNVPVDELAALARRYEADLGLIDAGAERSGRVGSGSESCGATLSARPRRRRRPSARRAAAALDKAVEAELEPLQARTRAILHAIEAESEGPDGLDRVEFEVAPIPARGRGR